jgi:hypothetical protein
MSRPVLLAMLLAGLAACGSEPPKGLEVPDGYVATLQIPRDGRLYRFGPFVGYYFRPHQVGDLSRLEFICFNEDGFYASDMPVNARLFVGEAVLTRLPEQPDAIPTSGGRIRPVFFDAAPQTWLESRPKPHDEFLHFHSAYDAAGAVPLGYWLRHEGAGRFTYDMGGRVGPDSPLHHRVEPGIDRRFARIVEFDFGPQR